MLKDLQPHSKEWFEVFHRINPLQAQLTKRLVDRAGHPGICTTCGDPPLADFVLQTISLLPLRLCPACHGIYLKTYGEALVKWPVQDNEKISRNG